MSYPFDAYIDWQGTGGNLETASLGLLLVREGSKLDPRTAGTYFGKGQPSAANLAAIVDLTEISDPNYTRKTATGAAWGVNTSTDPHRGEFSYTPIEFTPAIGSLVPPAIGCLWFLNAGSEALRLPFWYFNNTGTNGFPWAGGRDLWLINPTGGMVRMEGR